MFRNIRIITRIPMAFAAVLLPTIAVLVWISLNSVSAVISDAEKRELQSHYGAVMGLIDSQGLLAVGLAQDEGRQTVVVHVAPFAGDVQQAVRLRLGHHVVQRPFRGAAESSSAGQVPVGQECQGAERRNNDKRRIGRDVAQDPREDNHPRHEM